jgi:rubredoxin
MNRTVEKKEGERMENEAKQDTEYEVVYAGAECPKCGENRMDFLAIDEGEVTCATCGNVYEVE